MTNFFRIILLKPLFNLTILVYNLVPGHDLGLAIIALTVLIRLIFFPLTRKTVKSQQALGRLAPQVETLKEQLKNDPQAQSAAIMNLYRQNGVNPLSGCLPLLVQIPVLIALYRTFLNISKSNGFDLLYGFVAHPGAINGMFLGIVNLTIPSAALAVLAGILQFFQARQSAQMQKQQNAGGLQKQMSALNAQMLYFFPIMIIIISWNLPAGLTLYWVSTTALAILEQWYIRRTSA